MNNLSNLVHKTLDEMIALYPEPKTASTLAGSKAPPTLPPAARSKPAATPFGRTPVARIDAVQIRRKIELEEARLRRTEWTDERLAQISDEESATLAFSLSSALQIEFRKNLPTFLAYWRSLQVGDTIPKGENMTYSNDQLAQHITTEADAERLWKGSPALQAEFETAKALFCFARAFAQGHAKIFTR